MSERPPSPLRRLVNELRRRRVLRTAALYVVGGWVLMQVGDVTFPALDIPDRALRYVLLALLAGFPVALIFGWFYDLGPDGISRTPNAELTEANASEPLVKRDYILLTALLAVVAAITYNTVGNVVEEPVEPMVERPADRSGPPVVAVLPFTTTSREGDNAFFATGVHDDLLTQLSKLQSLRVISRTSVMEYLDVTRNLREIGARLGADVVMEGGVQIAGERIRINAQLIDARTDEHLWAHTYDRELTTTNIFDVQAEIARAISSALRTTLTPQDTDQLSLIPTGNMAAYRAYRRAMDMAEREGVYRNPEYRAALEEAVELDPQFTRALAELSGHLSYINFWGEPNLEELERAEEILERLRELAPVSADYLMALAYYNLYTLKDYDQAYATIVRAEEKAPSDLKILSMKTWILRRQGRHAERNPVIRKILRLDPKDQRMAGALVNNLMVVRQYEEASQLLKETPFDGPDFTAFRALDTLRQQGDVEGYSAEAIALHKKFEGDKDPNGLWEAVFEARQFEAAEAMLEELRAIETGGYPGLTPWIAGRLITYWRRDKETLLAEALVDAEAQFERFDTEALAQNTTSLLLDLALPPAIQGDVEKTVYLTQQWRNAAETRDATEYLTMLHFACRTLAISGAANEATACVRRGVTEPGRMHYFLEPYLPYYDSIRETPGFQALLAELK